MHPDSGETDLISSLIVQLVLNSHPPREEVREEVEECGGYQDVLTSSRSLCVALLHDMEIDRS